MAIVGVVELDNLRVTTSIDEDALEDSLSVLETDLTTLTVGQRVILGIVVTVLCVCSILGNVGTLWVNKRRQLRVFFRSCLISLALSDLITSMFTSLAYLAQFGAPSVQIWCLGGVLCRLIPFLTTAAILVSSMTLLGIAFDRYYSVLRASSGFWKPDKKCSIVIMVSIWVLSFFISIHLFFAYTVYEVYILREVEDGSDFVQTYRASMCVSNKEANAYYYLVVLAIIFVPTLVAFVWLNSIIANKLWIRRHSFKGPPSSLPSPPSVLTAPPLPTRAGGCSEPKEKQMEMIPQQYHQQQQQQHRCHCRRQDNKICTSSTLTVRTTLAPSTGAAENNSPRSNPLPVVDERLRVGVGVGVGQVRTAAVAVGKATSTVPKHISSREARHLRMFTIILILMAVFIFFRLPAWIFLILRMYGSYTHRHDWILHFSFGILTLTSCVLNPLLYTFLAETIRYAMFMKGKLCGLRRYFGGGRCHCGCWCFNVNNGDSGDSQKMTQTQHQDASAGNGNSRVNPKANGRPNVNGNVRDNDCTSNDGANSTSRKSDDDSEVYTIILDPERLQGCKDTQDDAADGEGRDGGRSVVPMLNA